MKCGGKVMTKITKEPEQGVQPGKKKRRYEKPAVLSKEELEVVAAGCTGGKSAPPTCTIPLNS